MAEDFFLSERSLHVKASHVTLTVLDMLFLMKGLWTFFFFFNFIYLFIYGCVGSSFLCEGFL